jgi:hypothetical protein
MEMVFFVLGVLLVFVILMIWGEHIKERQDAKDLKEIDNLNVSPEVKAKLYESFFRHQADQDLI